MTINKTAVIIGLVAMSACFTGCKRDQNEKNPSQPASAKASRPAATSAAASLPATGPRLSLERSFVDIGTMNPKSSSKVRVALTNVGDQDLTLTRAISACKCFKPSLEDKSLKPGQSTHVDVEVMSLDYRGGFAEGIGIASNDPAGPSMLTVRFEVSEDLPLEPSRLFMGLAKPGQNLAKQVAVKTTSAPAKIVYTTSGDQQLVGKVVRPAVTPDAPGLIEVNWKAPQQPGTYRQELTIATSHEKASQLRLPVVICVSDTATITPQTLEFGKVTRGDHSPRQLKVQCSEGASVKSATASVKGTQAQLSPDGQTIQVTLSDQIDFGPFDGELKIDLAGKESCTLSVPMSGFVTEKDKAP